MKKNCINIKTTQDDKSAFRLRAILGLSLAIFVASLFGQLYVTNQLAIKGKDMVALEQRRIVAAKVISELELEESGYSSLSYLEERARSLGFIKNNSYVLPISSSTSTASLQSL